MIFHSDKPVFLYPRAAALDPNISFEAKGLLAYMHAIDSVGLSHLPVGLTEDRAQELLIELDNAGYLEPAEQDRL
ncbi:hypothetical protein [Rhodococcus rhodochrous]|uniref:hypothetical protein n=1 Tax=Rhodococcus rhodochrous TaxID=1829 RepID=UPI00177B333B|nr:hypothetical protein [Rhodococcus rhodochrous]QOH59869.1 hypothetical protein C6Y44_27655 [Rhodococcus rhodochrous]